MKLTMKKKFYTSYITKRQISKILYNIFMIFLCVVIMYPFLWTFASAFKTNYQIFHESPINLLPSPLTFENFKILAKIYDISRMVFNGFYLAIVIPVLSLIVSSMAAYALARLKFKGRNVIFILLISTMMIPSYVTLIPNFAIMVKLGLLNSHWALILRSILTGSATAIFLFRQYFLSIPKDLENAAIVDGCSWAGVFFRIILPNSKPVIATVAILTFRSTWNAYLWPSIILQEERLWTWTLGLKLLSEWETRQSVLMAGSVISMLPIFIIYIVFQKYFVNSELSSGFTGV